MVVTCYKSLLTHPTLPFPEVRHTDTHKGMQFIELLDLALRGDAISSLTRPRQSCSSKSFSGCSEPIYDSSEPAESESGDGCSPLDKLDLWLYDGSSYAVTCGSSEVQTESQHSQSGTQSDLTMFDSSVTEDKLGLVY